jgi:hypothetical protein
MEPQSGLPLFELDTNVEPIGLLEAKTILQNLKNGKAVGVDELLPELLKYGA